MIEETHHNNYVVISGKKYYIGDILQVNWSVDTIWNFIELSWNNGGVKRRLEFDYNDGNFNEKREFVKSKYEEIKKKRGL